VERQKRVYPVQKSNSRLISSALLALTALVVISGLAFRGDVGGFDLQSIPQQTAVPLEESFDETLTEALVELPEETWYALQVGVFENVESAKQSGQAFQKRGAAGYLWLDGRYRVLAAAYPAQEEAQQVREQLRDQHNIDSYLYAIEFPSVSMRLKGMKGQIEILQAAFGHANDLARQLQLLAVEMDRQEISADEAVTRLAGLRDQVQIVSLRLAQRFGSPVHETVRALNNCFEDFIQYSESVSADESAVVLGMKMKYQLFATLQQIQKVYQTLNHT